MSGHALRAEVAAVFSIETGKAQTTRCLPVSVSSFFLSVSTHPMLSPLLCPLPALGAPQAQRVFAHVLRLAGRSAVVGVAQRSTLVHNNDHGAVRPGGSGDRRVYCRRRAHPRPGQDGRWVCSVQAGGFRVRCGGRTPTTDPPKSVSILYPMCWLRQKPCVDYCWGR